MRGRAVVKLASPSVAYLAYHEAFFNPTANTIFLNAVVVRLTRAALAPTWNAAEIFRFNGLNMPDQANGAISNTFWQDLSPMGFDIGNGGTELHIVVRHPRQVEGDPDDAFYFHCVDTGLTTCQTAGGGLNPGWTLERFPMNVGTSRFQPWVAAVQTAKVSLATVSWYQQITFSQFYPMGVIVGSDRPLPHTPVQLAPLYSPCATSVDPNTGIGTYGDYESTVATPYFAPDGPITNLSPAPVFVTAYTRSTMCIQPGNTPRDEFIGATTWW